MSCAIVVSASHLLTTFGTQWTTSVKGLNILTIFKNQHLDSWDTCISHPDEGNATTGTQFSFLCGLLLTNTTDRAMHEQPLPKSKASLALEILRDTELGDNNFESMCLERKAWFGKGGWQGKISGVRGIQATSHRKTGSTNFGIQGAVYFFNDGEVYMGQQTSTENIPSDKPSNQIN